jgi:hypothetical protein
LYGSIVNNKQNLQRKQAEEQTMESHVWRIYTEELASETPGKTHDTPVPQM